MVSIVIQGWRFIPHSYSIINQFQCLEMLKQPNVQIFHEDMPFYGENWQSVHDLFDRDTELALQAIQKPSWNRLIDSVLRITYPYNLEPSSAQQTYIFATAQVGAVTASMLASGSSLKEAHNNSDSTIITPSNWSKSGLIHSGADPDRVIVIPHGVDLSIYKPLSDFERNKLRLEFGWEGFVFLNVCSAMSQNKGIYLLLKAFASVIDKFPDAKLVLKGLDSLYISEELLVKNLEELTYSEAEKIMQGLIYIGESMPFSKVSQLYQAADFYVSPYLAEGFNLPVLEAIACGLPVICTKGGPTDDFTTQDFTFYIESKLQEVKLDQHSTGFILLPEVEHLIELMIMAVECQDFITQSRNVGPKFVANRFTWQTVVDQLLNVLIPQPVVRH
jgi:glycosyltransferase involved in cell wall biosynthesis